MGGKFLLKTFPWMNEKIVKRDLSRPINKLISRIYSIFKEYASRI